MTGGDDGRSDAHSSLTRMFDLAANIWSDLPSLNQGRLKHASCTVRDRVFVYGGIQYVGEY